MQGVVAVSTSLRAACRDRNKQFYRQPLRLCSLCKNCHFFLKLIWEHWLLYRCQIKRKQKLCPAIHKWIPVVLTGQMKMREEPLSVRYYPNATSRLRSESLRED